MRPSPRLISCAGAFPARTSAQPAREQGWLVSDPACFSRWPGSFASYDQESSSWRTCQRSLLGGWIPYSGRWPRAGMLRDGECSELTIHWSAPHTGAKGGSVSRGWPTMTTSEAKRGHGYQRAQGRIYPTLTGATGAAKAWPTPTVAVATGGQTSRGGARKGELLLSGMVRQNWPTPAASDNRDRGGPSMPCIQRRSEKGKQVMLTMSVDGKLNPSWVEMLQGFPQGWTLTDGPPLRDHNTPTSHRAPDHDSPTTETD